MNDLIQIKHNDNVYIIRNETPKYGELSIYVNEDNTRVKSECANPDGEKYRQVKVEWMYEKEKIAFNSNLMYISSKIGYRMANVDWVEEWTRAITNHIEIKTDEK